jgi:hypothetical protein
MPVYLVTWELNKAKPNYNEARARFIARLERYDHIKDPGLDSVVFISSTSTAFQISANLQLALDNNDRLVVSKLNRGEYAGWLLENVWKWIDARL